MGLKAENLSVLVAVSLCAMCTQLALSIPVNDNSVNRSSQELSTKGHEKDDVPQVSHRFRYLKSVYIAYLKYVPLFVKTLASNN